MELHVIGIDPGKTQMGHTIDVNENVNTITSLRRRGDAVNAPEKAIGA
jgi:hypothetical protein